MKVSDYIAGYFKSKGLNLFFGYQGGAVTPLIDSMMENGIQYIQNLHEQAAGFSADAYARMIGDVSVVVATNGPGATNLVSAIANAHFDSTPCLFITGQVNVSDMKESSEIRQNGFQEVDVVSMVGSITKYAVTVRDKKQIPYELSKAYSLALADRKGAVLLDIPLNVLMDDIEEDCINYFNVDLHSCDFSMEIDRVIHLVSTTKKPVCLIGGGVRLSGAMDEVRKFCKITGIPTVSTLMGLDVCSPTDIGFSGLYGRTYANLALHRADLIIILGARLSKRQFGKSLAAYAPEAKFIRVDVDPNEINRVLKSDVAICSDLKLFMQELNLRVVPIPLNGWKSQLKHYQSKYECNAYVNRETLDPVRLLEIISDFVAENTVITGDVGQNQMWVAQGWKLKKGQRILMSGGLGCMGFSLPAAIGAWFASSGAGVIAFMGDGGLQMNIQELQTIVHYNIPIKIVVFNNNSLGMIQEAQHKYFGDRYIGTKTQYSVPNIEKVATAYGIPYFSISDEKDAALLQDVFVREKACLIEVKMGQSPTRVLIKYDEQCVYQAHEAERE